MATGALRDFEVFSSDLRRFLQLDDGHLPPPFVKSNDQSEWTPPIRARITRCLGRLAVVDLLRSPPSQPLMRAMLLMPTKVRRHFPTHRLTAERYLNSLEPFLLQRAKEPRW